MRGEIGESEGPPGGERQVFETTVTMIVGFTGQWGCFFVMILLDHFLTGNTHIAVRERNL